MLFKRKETIHPPLILLVILLCIFTMPILAQDDDEEEEIEAPVPFDMDAYHRASTLKSLNSNLFGDRYDPDSGALSLSATDIDLPGNFDIPVRLKRVWKSGAEDQTELVFNNWDIVIPSIETNVGQKLWHNDRCTGRMYPPSRQIRNLGGTYTDGGSGRYGGLRVKKWGGGSSTLLYPSGYNTPTGPEFTGQAPRYVTNDFWKFTCLSAAQGGGEGFIGHAPNGDKYTFNILRYAEYRPGGDYINHTARLYASRIEDVNGNHVDISYGQYGPTRIMASDGRRIDIYYSGKRIIRAVANGRTWQYTYSTHHDHEGLYKVTLPDNTFWQYETPGISGYRTVDFCWDAINTNRINGNYDFGNNPDTTITIKHPRGATAKFAKAVIINSTVNQPYYSASVLSVGYDECPMSDAFTYTWALHKKTITGAGLSNQTWHYDYHQQDRGSYVPYSFIDSAGNAITRTPPNRLNQSIQNLSLNKRRTVTDPLGNKTVYYINRDFSYMAGKTTKIERYAADASSPAEVTEYSFAKAYTVGAFSGPNSQNKSLRQDLIVPTQTQKNRNGVTYTERFQYNHNTSSSTFSYGRPTRIQQYSSLGSGTRITDIRYTHLRNSSIWRLGLTTRIAKNNKEIKSHGYDGLGRRIWTNEYGVRIGTYAYHSNKNYKGALRFSKDALNNYTYYYNYYRGQPRQTHLPDGSNLYMSIDANGWVTSETDARGMRTQYQHNTMGWLTKIDRPGNWLDTNIAYTNVNQGLTKTVTHGSRLSVIQYDGLLRPILSKQQALNGGGKTTYIKTEYDLLGRTVFTSLPSASENPTQGRRTSYDVLNRMTEIRQTVAPYATTSYAYLSGNRTHVTDPSGAATTTTFSGYASPSDGQPIKIQQPLGVTTNLNYDIYGNMLTVRQYGNQNGYAVDQTHRYYYDSRQRLCRQRTPEGGDVAYAYDNKNRLTAWAKGLNTVNGCAAPSGNSLVTLHYDNRDRLTLQNYADSTTADISFSYDANANVTAVNRAGINRSYTYDDQNNLTQETFSMDGRTWNTNYTYNYNGFMKGLTLPSGKQLNYSLDGYGRVAGVSANGITYASGIQYHHNGLWSRIAYGNGQVQNQGLNARQFPSEITSAYGNRLAMAYRYEYDARGKITRINNYLNRSLDRSLSYDSLGRLTSAIGPWGTGSYRYDALANLRQKKLGRRTVDLFFNNRNQLSSARETGSGMSTATSGPFNHSYRYDSRGNTTSTGKIGFTYDTSDRPVAMTHAGGLSTYQYDGHLRRVKQTIHTNGSPATIYSIYSKGGVLLHQEKTEANETTDYLPLGGNNTGSIRIENGNPVYIHIDHQGSPVAETNSSGNVVWREHYTPYGEKLLNPNGNKDNQGFTGHIQDDATGLTYMQARYYDPVTGRFLSIDPVEFTPDNPVMFNRYTYVANDPVNLIDPDGREATEDIEDKDNQDERYCDNDDNCGDLEKIVITLQVEKSFWDNPGRHLPSLSQCFANCVEENRFDLEATLGTLVGAGAGAEVPKTESELRRGSATNNPKVSENTTRLSRAGLKTRAKFGKGASGVSKGLRTTGRVSNRVFVPLLIFEGFYDIGTIGQCSVSCN